MTDEAWVQAMLDVEAVLGGDALAAADVDIAALGRGAAEHASPVVPLAKRFPDTHAGATSQDILDTAMMLVTTRALVPLLDDANVAADAAGGLARRHRDTPLTGLTLLQPALPTTFGLKAAGWMTAIDEAARELRAVPLAVQMGGPSGLAIRRSRRASPAGWAWPSRSLPGTPIEFARPGSPARSACWPARWGRWRVM